MPFTVSLLSVKANTPSTSISGTIELKPMSTKVLAYEASAIIYGHASDSVDWEFEGTNPDVGITVWAMDEDDYEDYIDGNPQTIAYYYSLSSGGYTKKSGSWNVDHSDTWYILFINKDTDQETTTLTYDAEFIDDWFEEYGLIFQMNDKL